MSRGALPTGLQLLRTGELIADLEGLNAAAKLPHVEALIARKRHGAEQGTLDAAELPFHRQQFERLLAELKQAPAASPLPASLPNEVAEALHDFLVRVRLSADR